MFDLIQPACLRVATNPRGPDFKMSNWGSSPRASTSQYSRAPATQYDSRNIDLPSDCRDAA